MVQAYVSLGSNMAAEQNLCACLHALRSRFGRVACSGIYRTPAEGFDGPPFLNAVVGFEAGLGVDGLRAYLRELEDAQGRVRGAGKFCSRTLDADLLLYGELVLPEGNLPHRDILSYPFVLYPLAEIAPNYRHPVVGRSLRDIADGSPLPSNALEAVRLNCGQQDT